jgi:hypothetical protein
LDADGDGEVTLDEFLTGCAELGMFAEAPQETGPGGQRRLSHQDRQVFGVQAAALFDTIDTDGSNSIDRQELETLVRGKYDGARWRWLNLNLQVAMQLMDLI